MRTSELRFVFLGAMFSALAAVATAGDPIGTGFTYQGQLKQAGLPVTNTCDFEFSLWDGDNDPEPGIQIESAIPLTTEVRNGLFQVILDFGSTVFSGDARWLQVDVCCSSPCAPGFTTLTPRQPVTATPYALHTRGIVSNDDGFVGIGTSSPQFPLEVRTSSASTALFASVGTSVSAASGPTGEPATAGPFTFGIEGMINVVGGVGVGGDALAPTGDGRGGRDSPAPSRALACWAGRFTQRGLRLGFPERRTA